MIKGKDIIIVGQQPWDVEIGSNCKNIAIEFSKNNRVLYVNAPLDRISLMRGGNDEKIKKRKDIVEGKASGLLKIADNLWNLYPDSMIESINWIGIHSIFKMLNKVNNRRFASSIQKAIDALGFRDFILFNDNDMFRSFHLKEMLKPALYVYYSRDYMLAVDYWKKHGEKLEPQLIASSDICVANSTYLADYCRQFNPNSYYVGQGCELDLFMDFNGEAPEDMKKINGVKIGYVGALLGLRLDMGILTEIASKRPEWQLVLVGPEDELFKGSKLHQFPNVHFLGSKSPLDLPAYIHSFDICLNPQVISQVTIGNYPRKIDEYLVMGKPVIATSTPFMEAIFNKHTYLAKNPADYIRLIEVALQEDNKERQEERRRFAAEHTWENSVAEIYHAIEKHWN